MTIDALQNSGAEQELKRAAHGEALIRAIT
jgi:hypothetical protein